MAAAAKSSNSAMMQFALATTALDIMGGVFSYLNSQQIAEQAQSRARMLRLESEAEAQRYAEQARQVHAKTRLAYLKSGVELSGSPLDVLDSDILTAQENINAIRASGSARALEAQNEAGRAEMAGRSALVSSLMSGIGRVGTAYYYSGRNKDTADTNRKSMNASDTNYRTADYYGGRGRLGISGPF